MASKADKLGKNDQIKSLKVIREVLELDKSFPIVKFSKMTGQGREELCQFIEQFLVEEEETAE